METEKKRNYLYSAFICSEDNRVTIVASSNILIKVPQFSSVPCLQNHIHTSFWELNFPSVQSILLFDFGRKLPLLRNLSEQTTATHKLCLEARTVIQR